MQRGWLEGGLTRSAVSSVLLIIWQKNADFERLRAVLEKLDVVLHLNVVWRGVIADGMRI